MKKSNLFKKRIYPVLFMFILTALFITAVSSIYLSTKDVIKRNETLYLKQAILAAAAIKVPETAEDSDRLFRLRVDMETESGTPDFYRIKDENDHDQGWVLIVSGPGLWGQITAVVGFNHTVSAITGVEFIKQNETPGLGARIEESWFKNQFTGKISPYEVVAEGTSSEQNEIDAITGATRTTNFVLYIIQKAEEIGREAVKEAGK